MEKKKSENEMVSDSHAVTWRELARLELTIWLRRPNKWKAKGSITPQICDSIGLLWQRLDHRISNA